MQRVFLANPYRPGALRFFGDAKGILLRQYRFPGEYDERLDQYLQADHDTLWREDPTRISRSFVTYTEGDAKNFGSWLQNAKDSAVILFLKDLMKADFAVNWTGYRVTGSVNSVSGFPMFRFELFAKHPKTKTKVYSEDDAPNVLNPNVSRPAPVRTSSGIFRMTRT